MTTLHDGTDARAGVRQPAPSYADVLRALAWAWRRAIAADEREIADAVFTAYLVVADLHAVAELPEVAP